MSMHTPPPPRAPQLPVPPPVDVAIPMARSKWLVTPSLRFGAVTVGLVLVAAALGDVATFAGSATVAGFGAVAVAAFVLFRGGLAQTTRGAGLLVGAVAVAIWLPFRASSALAALNTATAIALLLSAALLHRVDRVRPAFSIVSGLIERSMQAAFGPLILAKSVPVPSGNDSAKRLVVPVVRGVVLAALPIALLAALLASADSVFASLFNFLFNFDPGLDVGRATQHAVIVGVLASVLSGLLCVAEARRVEDAPVTRPIGAVEAIVILGAIVVLFAAFATTQVVVALGGAAHILDTADLTRAAYAREGFFQLLAVAGFTLVLVVGVAAFGRIESRAEQLVYRIAATLVSLLTLSIVVVSVIRLDLYADAFGLTMLRLFSTAFAVLLGVVFVLFAASSALGGGHRWFWSGSIAAGLGALVILNAINPEAFIARTNIDHAEANDTQLDVSYLLELSPDAVPTVVAQIPERLVARGWCLDLDRFDTTYGPLGANHSNRQAASVLADLCAS